MATEYNISFTTHSLTACSNETPASVCVCVIKPTTRASSYSSGVGKTKYTLIIFMLCECVCERETMAVGAQFVHF